MEGFLASRNVGKDVIDKLRDDKIDCETVALMNDGNLKQYLPAYGDRVALMAFSRIRSTNSNSGSSMIRRRNTGIGNRNARRKNRKIELGWMNFKADLNTYKQVRSPSGGGIRHFSLDKSLLIKDFFDTAFDTFFPNGISKFGPRVDFWGEIRDFSGNSVQETSTVNGLYEQNRLRIVRIYLYTKKIIAETSNTHDQTAGLTELENDHTADEIERTTILDSGTPEVTFHPRHTGILQCRREINSDVQAGSSSLAGGGTTSQTHAPSVETRWLHTQHHPQTEILPESLQEDIYVMDSEDEALQEAIEASLQNETTVKETESIAHVLTEFQKDAVLKDVKTKIIVFRKDILQSALRALERKNINLKASLFVKFSGEIGEDFGGPRREFFRLAFNALHQSQFFEGPETAKIFTHNLSACETNKYQLVGRLVGLALSQDGPGLHFLDANLFDLMVGKNVNLRNANVPCMPEEMNKMIQQLQNTDTEQKRDQFLCQFGDMLMDQGMGNPYSMKADELLYLVKKHHLYYRISSEIAQFTQGMNEVSSGWDYTKKHAEVLKPLFCETPKALSPSDISVIFKFNLSVEGSNARLEENVTVYAWELFLQSIEDAEIPVTFPELLIFTTGADNIPPCGFPNQIEIEFYSMESAAVRRLPSVSTCVLQMWLPRGQDPDSLSELLVRAINPLPDISGF